MRTSDEILKEKISTEFMLRNNPDWTYNKVIEAIKSAQDEAWNEAIEAAAENARTTKTGNSGSWYDAGVDKQSILKLKK